MAQHCDRRRRRVQRLVVAYFLLVVTAMMWPVYAYFSRVFPLILGIPFSLFYLVVLLLLSFAVLLTFYLWETRQGDIE